jgi:hypothetical protein
MKNTVRYILFSALVILLSASQIPAKVATGQSSALGAEKQIALRAAIEDLITTFGPRYPRGKEYLAQLDRIEQRLKKAQKPDLSDIKADFDNLQHQALIDNPRSKPVKSIQKAFRVAEL